MKTNSILYINALIAVLLSGVILTATNVTADDSVVDQVNVTVPMSCTMSGTGMDSHNTEINNGQSNSSIGETTIKAFCNDANGFAIYAIGYTDNTDGKNVLTNSTLGDTYDIVTGTATGPVGNVDTSQWAMKLSIITDPAPTYPIIIAGSSADTDKEQGDPDFTSFQEVPDDYTLVAKRTSGTDINPSGQSTAEGATLKSTYQAYISKTQPAGTYTGQVKYTLVHPNDATKPIKPVTIATAEYLQEVNSCPADLSEEQVYTLKDSRDEQEYKVAKLKDGKCWMVENLNIAGGTALSSEDTDFDANYTLPTSNGWTVSNGKLILPQSEYPSLPNEWQAYVYNSSIKDCSNGQPCYSYYSWVTATAGSNTLTSVGTDAPHSICPKGWHLPSYSSDLSSDFTNLIISYGGSADIDYYYSETDPTGATMYSNIGPNSVPDFLPAGYFYTQFNNSEGRYHSSTRANNQMSFDFSVGPDSIGNGYSYSFMALSVRCLLRTN